MIKSKFYNVFLMILIFVCLVLVVIQNFHFITAFAVEDSATSNVSVLKALSISFSDNLSSGILFGDVSVLPATNINASHNYDGTSSGSTFFINVSEDGNTAVDLCIKASGNMISPALDQIGLANETYSNSTLTNLTSPILGDETSLTTSYEKSGENVPTGGVNYYRFWLDIPASQPSGDYNNTVSFKGIQTGVLC